ncbi:MAG: deoxyribodipyrimidine photo-lyase [Actinomycetes bacterium]
MATRSLFWFRRDLRLADNPALRDALSAADETLLLFIMDDAIAERSGPFRRAYLADSLARLDESVSGRLAVVSGTTVEVLRELTARYNFSSIHAAREFAPYGVAREREIAAAGIEVEYTGSPYAIAPGRVCKPDGTNYRVYTPFFRAWQSHGWRAPLAAPRGPQFVEPAATERNLPSWTAPVGVDIQEAGEKAALARWSAFKAEGLSEYDELRNVPGVPGTSRLSPHLRWGEIHPRTLLGDLNQSTAHETFRKEIAWREFYADVLHHNPRTSRDYYAPAFAAMRYDEPGVKFKAWCDGMTGYPIVDAAMRQLRQEGWMHNRARMVVASFLVKDLHIEWQYGADYFMKYLIDNDVASNSHGWQWTAGCGTDASPYYRVFNPIEQGRRFDPEGNYIKRFVPELSHLSAPDIHTPWEVLDGNINGYPQPIVDHALERLESLARLAEIKAAKAPNPHQPA